LLARARARQAAAHGALDADAVAALLLFVLAKLHALQAPSRDGAVQAWADAIVPRIRAAGAAAPAGAAAAVPAPAPASREADGARGDDGRGGGGGGREGDGGAGAGADGAGGDPHGLPQLLCAAFEFVLAAIDEIRAEVAAYHQQAARAALALDAGARARLPAAPARCACGRVTSPRGSCG
jgi:hypothetical protein